MKIESSTAVRYEGYNMTGKYISRWLEYQKEHKFSVGDYLIKKTRNYETKQWETKLVNRVKYDDVYRKYIILKIDEYNVPHIVPIVFPGTIGRNAFPMCNIDLDYERYELDPDYEIHLLLKAEEEFDPIAKWREVLGEEFKRRRDLLTKARCEKD